MTHTIMVMAGGTGGHVFPALAVADDLRARGWRVVWLGARNGMEATLVPQRGYEMRWVRFSGLRGKGLLRAFLLPMNLLVAFWQCARAIREVRPQVVLGMGGYISFPGGMMAALLNRPLVIHEQNSVAGLANRVLAQVADRVLSGFPKVIKNGHWVGNPVRVEIASLPAPEVRYGARTGPLRVLVVGGSLGAQALNETLPAGLALLPVEQRPSVVHQSGRRHIEALRAAYAKSGVSADAVDFIDDMAKVYGESDLVICRAGALTCAELAAAGVASVLVPFPHAVDDHQTTNARFLEQAGAAVLLPQKELSAVRLADLLRSFTRAQLAGMAQRARELARPQATREVAGICEGMAA